MMEAPRRRISDWLVPSALFVFLFVVYNLNGRFIAGSDVYSTRYMPANLAVYGTYYFPDNLPPDRNWNLGTRVVDVNSPSHMKAISVYPTYVPTILLPIYIPIYRWIGVPIDHFLTWYLDKWIASIFAAAATVLTFCLIRRMHGGRNAKALLAALGLGLGTSLWAIASQGSWAMGPSAFFLIFTVFCMERAVRLKERESATWWAALSGWSVASAFATRQSDMFFVLPFFFFGLWELRSSRRLQGFFFGGIVPVAAWFVLHNYFYFGHPLTTGYKYNKAQELIPKLMHVENFFHGFFGLLFSPSLGMFTMAPVTLFAIPGLLGMTLFPRSEVLERLPDGARIERRGRDFLQRVMILGAIFCVIHVLFYSCYLEWWAGWSYCYRYLIDIQPFLFLGVGWFFRPGARFEKYRWPMFLPALLFSAFVQFFGAFFWFGTFFDGLGKPGGNPTYDRVYVNLDPKHPVTGIFNRPSFMFSLQKKDHIILKEGVPSRIKFENSFATWENMRRDLCETEVLQFHPNIILMYGSQRRR